MNAGRLWPSSTLGLGPGYTLALAHLGPNRPPEAADAGPSFPFRRAPWF